MILLDTHTWIWWVNESPNLSHKAMDAIQSAEQIRISAISCWEVAMLVAKKRVGFSMDVEVWLALALQHPRVKLVPLTPEIAVLATRLPGDFHGDPADRLIVASSLVSNSSLVSKDQRIIDWGFTSIIW